MGAAAKYITTKPKAKDSVPGSRKKSEKNKITRKKHSYLIKETKTNAQKISEKLMRINTSSHGLE